MEIKEYVVFTLDKMEVAQSKGDHKEWIRLANLIIAVLKEQIQLLEK